MVVFGCVSGEEDGFGNSGEVMRAGLNLIPLLTRGKF